MEIIKKELGPIGANSYLVSEDNLAFVVDAPSDVKDINKNNYEIKALFLTHCHFDHILGIKTYKCPIYIYEEEYDALFDDRINLLNMYKFDLGLKKEELNIIKVKDNEVIDIIGHQIKVLHTPGHTKGSVCYLLDNKYLFTGDTLFKGSIGRTDFPGGDYFQMKKSLNKIKNLPGDFVIYPGHEEISTLEKERAFNPYFD